MIRFSSRIAAMACALGAAFGFASLAFAADGQLDTTWGTQGVSVSLPDSRPYTALPGRSTPILYFGDLDRGEAPAVDLWWPVPPGHLSNHDCTFASQPLFLTQYVGRTALRDRSGRYLFGGAIRILGSESTDRAFVARATTDGSGCALDSSFAAVGFEFFDDTSFCDDESCRVIDLAETTGSSPRYVLLIERTTGDFSADYYLLGLDDQGAPVTGYGSGGYRRVTSSSFGQTLSGGAEMDVDPSNRAYVLHAHTDISDDTDLDLGLTRFTAGGDLDTSFATNGTRMIESAAGVVALPVDLEFGPDGRLGAAFNFVSGDPSNSGEVLIFEPGVTGFGNPLSNPASYMRAITFDGLGRAYYARDVRTSDESNVRRLSADITPSLSSDPTFTNGAYDVDAGGANGQETVDLVLVAGRPMVLVDADTSSAAGNEAAVSVRFQNELIFADGFEWGTTRYWVP